MRSLRSIFFLVASQACWGLATVMSKHVLGDIPPITLLALQLFTSVIFLWFVVNIRHRMRNAANQFSPIWARSNMLKSAWLGILEPGMAYVLIILGLSRTSASNSSLLTVLEPVGVLLLAALLLRERLKLSVFVLAILGCIGMSLVAGQHVFEGNRSSLIGDGLIVLGTLMSSLYVVLTRRVILHADPLMLTAMQQTLGFLFVLCVWFAVALGNESTLLTQVPLSSWLWAIGSGIVQYSLAFWFYWTGAKNVSAGLSSVFLMLIPVFGVGGAYLFLGEQLSLWQWAGAGLILLALAGISQTHGTSNVKMRVNNASNNEPRRARRAVWET